MRDTFAKTENGKPSQKTDGCIRRQCRITYRGWFIGILHYLLPTVTAHMINGMMVLCLVNNNDNTTNFICSAKMGFLGVISEVAINH